MKIICDNCDYSWGYKGKMTKFVNCPNCRKAVKLKGDRSSAETAEPSLSSKEKIE